MKTRAAAVRLMAEVPKEKVQLGVGSFYVMPISADVKRNGLCLKPLSPPKKQL